MKIEQNTALAEYLNRQFEEWEGATPHIDGGWSWVGHCGAKKAFDDLRQTPFGTHGFTAPGNAYHQYWQGQLKSGFEFEAGGEQYAVVGHEQFVYLYIDGETEPRKSPIDTLLFNRTTKEFEVLDYKAVFYFRGIAEHPKRYNVEQINLFAYALAKNFKLPYLPRCHAFYGEMANWNNIQVYSWRLDMGMALDSVDKIRRVEAWKRRMPDPAFKWRGYHDLADGVDFWSDTKVPYRADCKYCGHLSECIRRLGQEFDRKFYSIDDFQKWQKTFEYKNIVNNPEWFMLGQLDLSPHIIVAADPGAKKEVLPGLMDSDGDIVPPEEPAGIIPDLWGPEGPPLPEDGDDDDAGVTIPDTYASDVYIINASTTTSKFDILADSTNIAGDFPGFIVEPTQEGKTPAAEELLKEMARDPALFIPTMVDVFEPVNNSCETCRHVSACAGFPPKATMRCESYKRQPGPPVFHPFDAVGRFFDRQEFDFDAADTPILPWFTVECRRDALVKKTTKGVIFKMGVFVSPHGQQDYTFVAKTLPDPGIYYVRAEYRGGTVIPRFYIKEIRDTPPEGFDGSQ